MRLEKLIKFLFLLVSTYLLSLFIQYNFSLNYNSTKLNAQLEIFSDEYQQLAHKKLFIVPGYSEIFSHFKPKKIANRLQKKINNSEICLREDHAKKRNVKIIATDDGLDLGLIFLKKENAIKCKDQLSDYFFFQKELFLEQSNNAINNLNKNHTKRKVEVEIDNKLSALINDNKNNSIKNLDAVGEYLRSKNIKTFLIQTYDLNEIKKNYELIKNYNSFNANLIILDEDNSKFKVEYLFIVIFILISLVVFNRDINTIFKNFKKKL